jgi:hypothetical protein
LDSTAADPNSYPQGPVSEMGNSRTRAGMARVRTRRHGIALNVNIYFR